MIIFFLNAPLHSFLIPQSRADSSYIIIERLLSLSPTIFLHHSLLSAPRDHSLQLPRCENLPVFCCWTCKPDWTKSNSAGLRQRAALHTKVDIKGADIWRCYRWWINSKKVHQVLRGPCGFSLFMSITASVGVVIFGQAYNRLPANCAFLQNLTGTSFTGLSFMPPAHALYRLLCS